MSTQITIGRAELLHAIEGVQVTFHPSYLGYHTLRQVEKALEQGYLTDAIVDYYEDEWDHGDDEDFDDWGFSTLTSPARIEVLLTSSGCERHDDPEVDFHPLYGPEPAVVDPEPVYEPSMQELMDALRPPVVRDVTFRHEPRGYSYIDVTMTNNEFIKGIIRYFNDELDFWASDLMGLTEQGVKDHWMKKDTSYLRR